MNDTAPPSGSRRVLFRIGWIVLLVLSALFAVNHIAGIWFIAGSNDESQMFEAFGIVNLLAVVLLAIPYRRLEWWSWLALWLTVIPIAAVIFFIQDAIGITYVITAGVMALAQLLTLPAFRAAQSD
jgi:hypothetical protein